VPRQKRIKTSTWRSPRPAEAAVLMLRFLCAVTLLATIASSHAFELRKVQVPEGIVHPESRVHPVNLLGDPTKELAVVRRNEVAIYQLQANAYVAVQRVLLPAGAGTEGRRIYYGFASLTPGTPKSMVVLTPTGLLFYPLDPNGLINGQPQQFYEGSLAKGDGAGSPVQYYDLALDFDADGVDELLVPEESGFAILHRGAAETYRKVPLPRNAFTRDSSFRFSRDVLEDPVRPSFFTAAAGTRRGVDDLLFYDANGDQKLDLIYSSTDIVEGSREVERYDVYMQRSGMQFESKPNQSLAVPYDSTAQSTFRDVNADGVLDTVLVRSNLDIVNPRTILKFFVGKKQQQLQVFSRETDRFVTKDPLGIVRIADFNGDKLVDFAMTFFSYQMGSAEDIVDLALANKIRFKLQFYLGRGSRGYNRQPDAEKEITLETKLEDFRGNPPVLFSHDLNGDGVTDLLVRTEDERLDVYPSRDGLNFGNKAEQTISIPADSQLVLEDLNGDGRTDLLVTSAPRQHLGIYLSTN